MSDNRRQLGIPGHFLKSLLRSLDAVRDSLDIAEEQKEKASREQLLKVLIDLAGILDRRFSPCSIKDIYQTDAKRSGDGEDDFR
jgi:hypothetical protein